MVQTIKIHGREYNEGEMYVDDDGYMFTITRRELGFETGDGRHIIRYDHTKGEYVDEFQENKS